MDLDLVKFATRRYFLRECWTGIGAVALASLLNDDLFADTRDPMAPRPPQFPARAKRVIFLNMSGGPSQLDLFDFKPKLIELHGKPIPKSVVGDQRYAFIKPESPLRGTERKFQKYGQCGMEISELLPHTAACADDICLIKSVVTDLFNHAPAELFINTGSGRPGRPSMGSWVTYGLGSEAKGLPGFVVLHSTSRGWNPGIQGRRVVLVERFHPVGVSGGDAAQCGRSGAVPLESAGSYREAATGDHRGDQRSQPAPAGDGGRSGDRNADCGV